MTEPAVEIRTASAVEKPCELYAHGGGSRPSVTQGHHIYPVYLQNRKYGKILKPDLIWLCGTCHDNTHAWLYWLMGDRRAPMPEPPPRAKRLAERAFEWYEDDDL